MPVRVTVRPAAVSQGAKIELGRALTLAPAPQKSLRLFSQYTPSGLQHPNLIEHSICLSILGRCLYRKKK